MINLGYFKDFSKKEQLFGFQKEQLLETFGNIFKSYKTFN